MSEWSYFFWGLISQPLFFVRTDEVDSLIISFECNKNVLMGISFNRLESAKKPLFPSSILSCITVVSLGEVEVAIGKSSKPTILISSGTL